MLAFTLALAVTLQDSTPARLAVPADAFADTGTANLVARARARRERTERLVTSYEATVTQRIGMGIRALRRDRMLFNQQMAARILWRRDSTSIIRMTGARQAIPVAIPGVHLPQALVEQARFLAFDPSEDYLRLVGNDPEGLLNPLADAALALYRYAPGDTTFITLPSGREIRLVELRITPRHIAFRLVTGSLWFDADTWGVVRMVVRPSRPFDLELDGDSGDADDVPGIVRPIRADVRFITVEYGLYQSRWWLPRLMAIDAEATVGSFIRTPLRFERLYEIHGVTGGGEPPPASANRWRAGGRGPNTDSIFRADSLAADPDSIAAVVRRCVDRQNEQRVARRARRDSVRAGQRGPVQVNVDVSMSVGTCVRRTMLEAAGHPSGPDVAVELPDDTLSLLTSATLGEPILDMGDIISEGELRQLGDAIGMLPDVPVRVPFSLGVRQWRYNRVEALSFGVAGGRALGELGGVVLEGRARLGIGDLEPNGELRLTRPRRGTTLSVAGYRRLVSVDPPTRALGFGNSVTALLFGRDDGDYYRTLGGEITLAPGAAHSGWIDVRLFGEQQRTAAKETDFSLVHLADGSQDFRPNITAARADQLGASLTLRGFRTFSQGFGVGADFTLDGQTGSFDFARSMLTLRSTLPLSRTIVLGLEGQAGVTTDSVPPQSLFYIGGPQTLRGYSGNVMRGSAFWRTRVEVGYGFPAFRLSLFSDAAWAGSRTQFGRAVGGRALISGGGGFSVLDGLIRLDISRGMRTPRGWRFDVYADGVL